MNAIEACWDNFQEEILTMFNLECNAFSVSDPYHFDLDPDPDPWIRIRDHGSGSEVTFDSVNRIFPIKFYARL